MKYLILGSSGQIGGHLSSFLEGLGHSVSGFDIERDASEDLRIHNNKILEKSLEECDFVFFLAYDVGGSRYLLKHQDTAKFIDNNMRIMSNTFEAIERHNKPFIFASSQMSYIPNSSYGILKRLGEKITADLGGVITRFWNVYGIEKDENKSHIITDLTKIGLKTRKIKVMTDGTEKRQFLYADDCSQCLTQISENYDSFSKTSLDISGFSWTQISDVAKIIARKLDISEIEFGTVKDTVQNFGTFDPDPGVLKFWRPQTSLEDGIDKIIEYERSKLNLGNIKK